MCRDVLYYESKENTSFFDTVADKLLPVLKQAKEVFLNGGGELFVSEHFRRLLSTISNINPNIKYGIITNGILCDEEHFRRFGLLGKTKSIIVSLHATTKQTYDKIVRGGNFDMVMKNIKWLSGLKKDGKIWDICINFVVSSINYKEMVSCVKMANKLGFDVRFLMCRNWDFAEMHKPENFPKYTVWEKSHKKYKSFLKELRKLKRFKNYFFNEPLLVDLSNSLPERRIDKIIKFFKKKK